MTWFEKWDAHHRFTVAVVAALAVMCFTGGSLHLPVRIVVVWNTFAWCLLLLTWIQIVAAEPAKFLSNAKLQDSSRTALSFFVIAAAGIGLFAVGLLGSAKGLQTAALLQHVFLSVITVVGSWSLIHTILALRYAHIYYGDSDSPTAEKRHAGGLDFPGEPVPDYLDFAYFSFVIGMTCQVSDVDVTGRSIRRLALVHGILSFAFNTVILALSINIVSGLL